jgi:hypothetical protein
LCEVERKKMKAVRVYDYGSKKQDIGVTLDKESTSYNDIFDAFRLAMKFYHFGDSGGG